MLIEHIELMSADDVSPLSDWFTDHPTAQVERVVAVGFHFYIFYTE